jgi:alkanesulfonate monooxygenase SsuD/methylene tetrahydromethanopterin reductase-like flavin-dependent oxidoreductase (luciferase family)
MRVGMASIFQNQGEEQTDANVYQEELRMADLAEPLGFDSLWSVEHHFTDYTMMPDALQFLSYMAGRTKRIQLGSMVVVLPWHDPIRVAEEIALLDQLSGGRFILGIGRGAGRVEFDGFRIPMSESRGRFTEAAQIVLEGLERGYCEFEGEFFQQPRRDIRPRPGKSFRDRAYAAAVSPESVEIMARLGVGILIIPQKPWDDVDRELASYRETFQEIHGEPAPPPVLAGWVYCDEDEGRAREGAEKWITRYYRSAIAHYEFTGEHFKDEKGYEFYARISESMNKRGTDAAEKMYMELQVHGTPKQCTEQIRSHCARVGAEHFVSVFSYAGMPWDQAEQNLRLFGAEVLPGLQKD